MAQEDQEIDITEPPMPKYPYLPIDIFAITLVVQDGQFDGFVADVSIQNQPKLRLAFGRYDRMDTPYDTRVTAPNMRDRIEKNLQEWYIRKYGTDGLGTARLPNTARDYIRVAVNSFLDTYVPPKNTPTSGPEVREINGITVTGYGLDNLELVLSPTNDQFAVFPKNTNIPVKVLNAVKDGQILPQITYGSMREDFTPKANAVLANVGEAKEVYWWRNTEESNRQQRPIREPVEDDPAKVRARYEATIAEAMIQDPKVAEAASLLAKSLTSPSLAGFTNSEIEQLNQMARASLANRKRPLFGGAYNSYITMSDESGWNDFVRSTVDKNEVDISTRLRDIGDPINAEGRSSLPNQRAPEALPAVQPTEFTRAIDLSDYDD